MDLKDVLWFSKCEIGVTRNLADTIVPLNCYFTELIDLNLGHNPRYIDGASSLCLYLH